ncbi:MAG: aminopeptidase Metallo peptidase family [Micrococcaceae bacterium]|nr:aminopeptidase Metallo peptidase family [Micrococcaceae bacterium]
MSNVNLQRDEAAARAALLNVTAYDVLLDLRQARNPAVPGFSTRSTITFDAAVTDVAVTDAARTGSSSTFLDFLGGPVHSVILNGREQPIDSVVDGARILLHNLQDRNTVTVEATALYSTTGEGLHRFQDPVDGQTYLYTQYEPADARRVFANFEQPDLKATFTFTVLAPQDWQVVSNTGVRRSGPMPSDAGSRQWEFTPTECISTYITSVLAGPYASWTDAWEPESGQGPVVPLAAYCRASIADSFDPDRVFATTKAGLAFFTRLFDYPYPFGKYDQAFVPEYNLGAMENPGLVTFTESYVYTSRATDTQYQQRANTLLHEMAHMWFGDLVTMRWWNDLWLKESFADYMGHLGVAEATEWREQSWVLFANRRKSWAYVQDQLPTTHPIVADVQDLEAAKQNFDGITYAKGASVLKQLVAYVGFDAFITGARNYFRRHAFGNTSLHDLLEVLTEASKRDLGPWAQQWLQTSGISTLTPEVEVHDGALAAVTLRQDALDPRTGRQELRNHRLRIGLYFLQADGALVRRSSVEADIGGASTPLPALSGQPAPDLLLVNDGDLTYAKVRLDARSQHTVLAHLDRLADPLARTLCWSALWNATRDALLPAAEYVLAVVRFAAAEAHPGVLQTLLTNATVAIDRYAAAESRENLRGVLLRAVTDRLRAARPGSDVQLVWARLLALLGRSTPAARDLLAGLLDGTVQPAGLRLDSDLRWRFWQALAATGGAGQQELDTALAADPSTAARAAHRTAITAIPDAGGKAAAWRDAVDGTDLSNELLSATLEGFRLGPPGLRTGYRERYFAVIAGIWANRSIEMAGRLVRGLYPGTVDLSPGQEPEQHPVLVRTDRWLEDHPGAPAGLRRILLEEADDLLRALRAQHANRSAAPVPSAG